MKRHLATIILGLFVLVVMALTGFYSWQESNALVVDCTKAQNLPDVLRQWGQKGGLLISRGPCDLNGPVHVDFGFRIGQAVWRNEGGSITFRGGGNADGITFSGSESVLLDSPFFQAPLPTSGYSDVHRLLIFRHIRATIRNASFYGLASTTQGAALIYVSDGANVRIYDSKFRGNTSNSGGLSGTILADQYTGLVVEGCDFADYGNYAAPGVPPDNFWSKTAQSGSAWINIRNPSPASAINTNPSLNVSTIAPVVISNNLFDEGATWAVVAVPAFEGPPIHSLRLENNVSNVGVSGMYYLRWIRYLDIDTDITSWRPLQFGQVDAIFLSWIERATVRNFWTDPTKSATRLTADAGVKYLQLINSRFTTVNSQARVQCETNNGPEVCITR